MEGDFGGGDYKKEGERVREMDYDKLKKKR